MPSQSYCLSKVTHYTTVDECLPCAHWVKVFDISGALKSFLVVCSLQDTHHVYTISLSHTHIHMHTNSSLQARRISHGLPRARLCCSECIATGNLTHHRTRGSSASTARPVQPTARSTKSPFGKETAPNAQSSYDCQRQLW